MSRNETITVDDYVSIFDDVIERKVAQLVNERKNKVAARWESYRNLAFRVKEFDLDNLAILVDVEGNEIHISRKALYKVRVLH